MKIKFVLTDVPSVVETVEHFIHPERTQVVPEGNTNIDNYTAAEKNVCSTLYIIIILITIVHSWREVCVCVCVPE